MHSVDIENRRITTRDMASTSHKWWTLAAVCTGRVHAPARHHDRERRAARHRAGVRRVAVGPAVGDQRLRADARRVPAHGRLARRPLRPAAAVRDRDRDLHRRLARAAGSRPARSSSRSRAARQGVGGAIMFATSLALLAQAFQGRTAASRSGSSARSRASRSRSGPCSAERSRPASRGAGSSTSTSRSAIVALAITLLRVEESRNPQRQRPDWAGFVTFSAAPRGARVRPDREPARRLGLATGDRSARGKRACCSRRSSSSSASRRADARPRPAARADVRRRAGRRPGRSRPRCSRCSPT